MTTRVWANGDKTTAIANIKADLANFISFNASGQKVVDTDAMRAYLIAQFQAISTSAEYVYPATADTALAAAQNAPVQSLVASFDSSIGVGRWSSRVDWPTDVGVLAGGTLVGSVKAAMTECATLAAAITSYYSDVDAQLATAVTNYYTAQGIDSLVPAGVVPIIETRTYIYTYVNDRNEESAPSPASALADFDQNDTANVTVASPPGGRDITHFRVYCSTLSNSQASFDYIPNASDDLGWPIGTLTILDDLRPEARQEPCPTTTWAEPPANLIGLSEGPNGTMAGFFDNTFCPCEPFVPYAWPVEYQKTTGWPIVGIGRFGQTYVVLTRGKPYYMTGADSQSLDSQPIDSNQACVSRKSIVNVEGGVVFASAEGLCLADSNGIKLITEGHFSRKEWAALAPSSIFAAEQEGSYIFHYNNGVTSGCYGLDLRVGKLTTLDGTGSAFYRDLLSDTLYLASGTTIKAMFSAGTQRDATWKSKIMAMPNYANLGWAQIQGEFDASVTLTLWRDGTLTDTVTITSRAPVRLSSLRAIEHEVQIESTARVTSLTLASTAQELRAL
jgi:hypothetical protein